MIQIQHRRGTAQEWHNVNPILAEGELGVETDTLKVKLGNGTTDWNHLSYFTQGVAGPANSISIGTVTSGATSSATITGTAPLQTLNLVLEQGDAGTITVGTTENKLPGTTAEVTNTGDNKNAIFNFKIPRGTTVAAGTTTTKLPGTSAEVVNSGTASDLVLDFKVPRGSTIALGTTTTGDTDSMASVTNSGTASDLVLDFAIPRGAGVPTGGTAGQILAKSSGTNFDTVWMENYADYTSTVKHNVRAGEALTIGMPVYVTGYNGGNMVVSKASNDSEATSSKVLGLLAQALANNAVGYVITEGLVQNVNTSTATVGDPVWLGTAGGLLFGLANKPVAPAHMVFIGVVTKVGTTTGEIWCKVQNGFELNELHDVLITNPTNGQSLTYQDGKFINSTPASNLDSLTDVTLTSPTDKQVLQYEASSSQWKNKAATGGVTTGATPPATPMAGDAWYDTTDGLLYVYYDDGNTSQWVEVKANSAFDATITPRVATLEGRTTALEAIQYTSPNYIINGGFDINQRAFTSISTGYGFDRWAVYNVGGTVTYSTQAFAPGAGPASYESKNFARVVVSGQSGASDQAILYQYVEDVRVLAGNKVTISFWAKSASGTPNIGIVVAQLFGSGGSPSAAVWNAAPSTVSMIGGTSWTRYSTTVNVPSISGKTLGTTDNTTSTQIGFLLSAGSSSGSTYGTNPGIQANTFDIWGVQVELGSVATPFRRNANSLQGELAACQRYLEYGSSKMYQGGASDSYAVLSVNYKVNKRITPTITVSTAPGRAFPSTGFEWNELDGFCGSRPSDNEIAYAWKSECEM